MIVATKKNDMGLLTLVQSIEDCMDEWQIVHINLSEDSQLSCEQLIESVSRIYSVYEGVLYSISKKKFMMLIRFGLVRNYALMRKDIEQKLPQNCCRIVLRKMNANGLKQIQIDLTNTKQAAYAKQSMFIERQERKENVILVADDDLFVRKSMKKLLENSGNIIESENGRQTIAEYLNQNPDVLFLDIHMPDKNGLDIIEQIMEADPDAFIVLISADSSAQNVMTALEQGAIGFLSKPPSKVKIQEYINQCITTKSH